jgi:hypothetical protein
MSRSTVFLARSIGLFTIFTVLGVLIRGSAIIEATVADGPVMFSYALISLAAGVAMMVGHNVWSGGALPVVVTVVGWLIFAKGLLLLFVTPEALTGSLGRMHYVEHTYLYLAPAFVIGLYLTWAGFTVTLQGGLPRSPGTGA